MLPPLPRLGLHYFPDINHYRQNDLKQWLPILQELRVSWLTLYANSRFSIPEAFLSTLGEHKIRPIIHLLSPLNQATSPADFSLLFKQYARWGSKYIVLFDRPNLRQNWSQSEWIQVNPVERFLDIWIPVAETALEAGLTPVVPPLEPGGDYWDTAFLISTFNGLQKRGKDHLIKNLALSALAQTDPDHLDWGRGGPACWPDCRPYFTPNGSQNHQGFHAYEWYLSYADKRLGVRPPMILLQAGAPSAQIVQPSAIGHAKSIVAILKSLIDTGEPDANREIDPIPDEVVACNFWLLAEEPGGSHEASTWFTAPWLAKPTLQYPINWLRQVELSS